MTIEDTIRTRLIELIDESGMLSLGNQNDQCTDQDDRAACSAWITAAQNIVHLMLPRAEAPYRQKVDRIAGHHWGYVIHHAVSELAAVLSSLLDDAEAGLLASVADQARAETFDDFLDHALHYLRDSRKRESGVIAGVVFEDTLRRVCRKLGIPEKGQKLDALISELASRDELTAVKAKRARAAADVRTRATHAQWDDYEPNDVQAAIDFTRELIETKLT